MIKKLPLIALLSIIFLIGRNYSYAQNVTVSPGNGSYATLSAAFTAISAGSHTGNVTVTIANNTTESGTCALFLPNTVTSVLIRPSGNRTISGDISGAPLVDINSASNVTIDGLNTGGNSLTISNTATSGTAQTSTLMVRNDAKNVTVKNCTLLGSSTVSGPTIGGTIFIGNTLFSLSATGNDNLVIENNRIGPAGINFPAKAVHCNGYASNQPTFQERIRISGNRVYDFFNATGQSHGFLIQVGKSVWTIRENHFYQTTAKAHTANAATQTVLESNAGGTGTAMIEKNTIGYASANKTGRYEILSPGIATRWYGIRAVGAGNTVRENTITEISISGTLSGSGMTNPFSAIYTGDAPKIFKNTIGSNQNPNAITLTNSNSAQGWYYGVWANANGGILKVDSNLIAGIKVVDATNSTLYFTGIHARTAGADTNYVRHNRIGTEQAPVENTSLGSFSRIVGIRSEQAHCIVEGNIVANFIAETGNIGSTTGNPLTGIEVAQTSGTLSNSTMVMQSNTISHLRLNHPTTSGWVKGIDFLGPAGGNHHISGNFIHNLLIPNSNSASATVVGINTNHSQSSTLKGNTMVANNMIALGAALTTNLVRVYGVFETTGGNNMQYYYNTIHISGAVASGTASQSIGIRSSVNRFFLNNIIVNQRTNTSGTSKHYAMTLSNSATGPALKSDHNILLSGSVLILSGITDYTTLANWQTASGQDANSLSTDPLLVAPTAATPDLHLRTDVMSPAADKGTPVPEVLFDFDGDARSATTPDIGADESVNPLPVRWAQFTVTPKGRYNELHWSTLTETNNLGFDVERSEDGVQFSKIGFVGSKAILGNSAVSLDYHFTDILSQAERLWYRIKQVDKDGKFSYSRIVMVGEHVNLPITLEVWPNPTKNLLKVSIGGLGNKRAEISLINLAGQTCYKKLFNGNNEIINIGALPSGIYSLIVHVDGKLFSKHKIVKQ